MGKDKQPIIIVTSNVMESVWKCLKWSNLSKVLKFQTFPLLNVFTRHLNLFLFLCVLIMPLVVSRVAKCHRYGRYICVKISRSWGKKFVVIQNRQFFWAHFNNYSGIFLQNSLQVTIFGIFAHKFASYAHLIL